MPTHAKGRADWGRTMPIMEYSVREEKDGKKPVLSKVGL